jgi:hypothetical protein
MGNLRKRNRFFVLTATINDTMGVRILPNPVQEEELLEEGVFFEQESKHQCRLC